MVGGDYLSKSTLKEQIKSEYLRCGVDPVYFFKKYAKISHPTKGKIPFELFPFQEEALRQFRDNRFNIVNKSRQMGISTLCAAHSVHNMLFNDEFKILVIATKSEVAKNLIDKVQGMFELLPDFLKAGITVVNKNKSQLSLSNGSSVKAVASSPDAGRSEGLSLLIIDEAAHIEYAEDIWTSAQPTLSTGGKCIILSTPNGQQGLFYRIWQTAEEGTSIGSTRFNAISLPWYLHPERDQTWRDDQEAVLGKRQAAQECDCSFLSSGNTVIDPEILQFLETKVEEPIEKRGIGGDVWIWEYPHPLKSYVVAADPARGDGEDYSGLIIMEIERNKQVAEFKGKIDTQSFGRLCVALSIEYNNALLVIDNKNIGWSTVQVALDSHYPNLYYSYKNDPYLDENIHLRKQYDMRDKEDMVPGLTTTTKIRPVLISKLEMYYRDMSVLTVSKRLLNELKVFMWTRGKAQAQTGYNDDLVMALAMCLYIRDTSLKLHQIGINLNKVAIQNTHRSMYKAPPIGLSQWHSRIGVGSEVWDLRELLDKRKPKQ